MPLRVHHERLRNITLCKQRHTLSLNLELDMERGNIY